ncbi:MAG: pyridoxamine 5'-phosphate oxidase family protein [Verrucomicrobiota bacterium]
MMLGELAGVFSGIEENLVRASRDGKHDWRRFWLGTVGLDGGARVRMVVLRGFEREGWVVTVFTDRRSPKWGELEREPRAELNFWNGRRSVQVRARGEAELLGEGELWEEMRGRIPERSRGDYCARVVPGEEIGEPEEGWELGGEDFFGVIRVKVKEVDWLELSREGHRRACFEVGGDEVRGSWVQP